MKAVGQLDFCNNTTCLQWTRRGKPRKAQTSNLNKRNVHTSSSIIHPVWNMRIASFACAFLFSEVATGALQDKIEHFASNECVGTPFATSQNLPEYRCTALPLWPISSLDQKLLGNFTSIPSHVVLSTTPIALVAKFYEHGDSLCNPNTTTITQLSTKNIDSGCCIPIAEKYAIRVASFHGDWTSCSKHQVRPWI